MRRGGRAGGIRRGGRTGRLAENPPPLVSKAQTPAEFTVELGEGIKEVRQAAGWNGLPPADRSSYDILHERVCQLYLTDITFPTWVAGGELGGSTISGFPHRAQARRHRSGRLAASGPDGERTIQRAILGSPITFFFKSIFAELTGRGVDSREARRKSSATVAPARGLGCSSPLFFRVVPLAGEPATFTVLMGVFRSRFLPDHDMTVKPNDFSIRPVRVDAPTDFALIEHWFEHVRKQQVGLLPVELR